MKTLISIVRRVKINTLLDLTVYFIQIVITMALIGFIYISINNIG